VHPLVAGVRPVAPAWVHRFSRTRRSGGRARPPGRAGRQGPLASGSADGGAFRGSDNMACHLIFRDWLGTNGEVASPHDVVNGSGILNSDSARHGCTMRQPGPYAESIL
jgi:hypothetical protein